MITGPFIAFSTVDAIRKNPLGNTFFGRTGRVVGRPPSARASGSSGSTGSSAGVKTGAGSSAGSSGATNAGNVQAQVNQMRAEIEAAHAKGTLEQLKMIQLQQKIQQQNQMVSMVTNLQKAEHDTRMASIRNLRV